jgi:hypothetical protein
MATPFAWARHAGGILLAGLAYYLGSMLGSGLATGAGVPTPALPDGVDTATLGLYLLIASPLVPLALVPLSRGMAVGDTGRWLGLALLAWIPLGVNTALEAAVFSPAQAAVAFSAITYGVASLACAAVVARLYPYPGTPVPFGDRLRSFLDPRPLPSWTLRLLMALVAFPAIYLVFGMAVRPFIESYYTGGELGLRVPGWGELLVVLFVRSFLFLLACAPVLIAWRGPPRRLAIALGAALFVVVGGVQMLQSYWLPGPMRLVHGLEIMADSFAYATAMVLLLAPGSHEAMRDDSPNRVHRERSLPQASG